MPGELNNAQLLATALVAYRQNGIKQKDWCFLWNDVFVYIGINAEAYIYSNDSDSELVFVGNSPGAKDLAKMVKRSIFATIQQVSEDGFFDQIQKIAAAIEDHKKIQER